MKGDSDRAKGQITANIRTTTFTLTTQLADCSSVKLSRRDTWIDEAVRTLAESLKFDHLDTVIGHRIGPDGRFVREKIVVDNGMHQHIGSHI